MNIINKFTHTQGSDEFTLQQLFGFLCVKNETSFRP